MILIVLSAAWVAGIFIGSLYHIPFALTFTGLLPLPLLFILPGRRKIILLCCLTLFLFFGGSIRYSASVAPIDNTRINYYNGETVTIRGMVAVAPDIRDQGTQLEISVDSIQKDGTWRNIRGKVLLFVPGYCENRYGDILQISGKLEAPEQLGDFDYRGYLANKDIYSTMSYPAIELIDSDKGNPVMVWVYSARGLLSRTLTRILPEPQASLAQGILLGMRGNIPPDLKNAFVQSGAIHILAISGQNLSIVAGILITVFVWLLGRRYYLYIWLAAAVIWIYTLMTGASAPVVRSAAMITLFLFAEFFGRQRSAGPALAFAASIMTGLNPSVLRDVSFQLSFVSMAGLVYISPLLLELSRRFAVAALGESGIVASGVKAVVDSFCVTLAALLAVWPLLVYYFNIVSLAAPLSTLLAVPSLTGIIVLSALAGGLGLLFLPLGQVFGWAAWLFLSYLLLVVRGFAAIPASFFKVNSVSPALIAVYYISLAVVLWLVIHHKEVRKRLSVTKVYLLQFVTVRKLKWAVVPLLIAAILVAVAAWSLPDNKLHVSFLDVGQGDAILVRQGSQQVLIDGGPSPQAIIKLLGARLPFWDRDIELIVLTHPDSDHMSGLVEVLRRYHVEAVVFPEYDSETKLYLQWKQLLVENQIKTTIARTGQKIDLGNGIELNVLNPAVPAHFDPGSDDNSVVLRLTDGKFSFLFTGDIYTPAENSLISDRADLASTVLKVAHHGSANSSSTGFLNTVSPAAAVISVGKNNDYGHPAPGTLARLSSAVSHPEIYRTDEDGTVEFTTDGVKLWVTSDR